MVALCPVSASPILTEAARVLEIEGQALLTFSRMLEPSFESAVLLLEKVTGKIILSGAGKSGHVARKISSTLASTGSPSFFLHPTEASHGDLGMISANDVLMLISNSGETAELSHLITYSRRHQIPLIAITAKPFSTLATCADVVLRLPDLPEACPMGFAPTTSTTLTLGLGDALALVLLKRKNFVVGDYGQFHPGGSLGRKLMKVSEIMRKGPDLPLVLVGGLMGDALVEMTSKRFGCVGVIGPDQQLLGVITDGDIRRHMSADLLTKMVQHVMTPRPLTIDPDCLAAEALALMNEKNVTVLFVVDCEKKVLGLIRLHDCLKKEII